MSGAGVAAALRRRAPNTSQDASTSNNVSNLATKPKQLTMPEVIAQTRNNVHILQQSLAQMNDRMQVIELINKDLHQMTVKKDDIIHTMGQKITALESGHVYTGTNTLDDTNTKLQNMELDVAEVKNMILKLQNKLISTDYKNIMKSDVTNLGNITVDPPVGVKMATEQLLNNGDMSIDDIHVSDSTCGTGDIDSTDEPDVTSSEIFSVKSKKNSNHNKHNKHNK